MGNGERKVRDVHLVQCLSCSVIPGRVSVCKHGSESIPRCVKDTDNSSKLYIIIFRIAIIYFTVTSLAFRSWREIA